MGRRRRTPAPPARRRIYKPAHDRAPPVEIIAGTLQAFNEGTWYDQLNPRLRERLEKMSTMPNDWLVVFSGAKYRDVDKVMLESSAKATVKHFSSVYPEAQITWLEVPKPKKPKPEPAKKGFNKKKWQQKTKGRKYHVAA